MLRVLFRLWVVSSVLWIATVTFLWTAEPPLMGTKPPQECRPIPIVVQLRRTPTRGVSEIYFNKYEGPAR